MQRGLSTSLKCVLVGDAAVGKTVLVEAYTKNTFNDNYTATTFDNYSVTVNVDNKPLRIDISDTAGVATFDSLRPLSYAEANVFLLCFKVTDIRTLNSITEQWLPEIRAVSPHVPVILVGTQQDMRLGYTDPRFIVDPKRVRRLAEQLNIDYIECSALTHRNLKAVFDLAILNGLKNAGQRNQLSQPIKKSTFINSTSAPPLPEKNRTNSLKDGFRRLVRKLL
ncbi:Rho-related GTP-binding protein RhoU [Aphelenchoides besseyi]|nr:Rho-related GTP-binding protein RhoU [Aphelenchoides besseyi]KAI6236905.1 Rho-related GTP-binding protein RhoU [Aphelenchoides besseyi]